MIWCIGLSGAGKSTLAKEICFKLDEIERPYVMLDGDVLRAVFDDDLGHSLEDRRLNAGRLSRLSKWLESQGVDVVAAVLSIFPDWQDWNRKNIQQYFEVFVNAELAELVARDAKGLYAEALSGHRKDVVGIDLPFPIPEEHDYEFKNSFLVEDLERAASEVLDLALQKFSST